MEFKKSRHLNSKINNMNISINKPCHEDWSKMTPNEQGAFCGICTKNVVDFSKKSLEEIKKYFSKPAQGKLCGRFTEDQLMELNAESFIERFLGFRFTRKVATLTALAFVAILLSANPMAAQKDNHIKMGKIKAPITQTVTPVKTGEVKNDTIKGTKQPEEHIQHIKGDVMADPKDTKPKTIERNSHVIMGGVGKPR